MYSVFNFINSIIRLLFIKLSSTVDIVIEYTAVLDFVQMDIGDFRRMTLIHLHQ